MRVTSKTSSSPGVAPTTGVSKPAAAFTLNAPSAVPGSGATGDALSVSSAAQFIAVAEAHLAMVPDIRTDKVDALKAKLESDEYNPDGKAVARGIVKEYTPPKEP